MRIGDFVICRYEGEVFLGVVAATFLDGNKATIEAMQKCIGGWRWSEKDDEIDYLKRDILKRIKCPVPINN